MTDQALRRLGAVSGVGGSVALAIYFAAPASLGWPYSGAPAAELASYARSHELLSYAGAWLQVTGALLSVILIPVLVRLSRAASDLAGLVTMVASGVLLAVVVIEAALLVAVPIAAAAGDTATVSTTFALSNGVFVRVFPMAPASASLIGLGVVLRRGDVLHHWFGETALGLGIAFEARGSPRCSAPSA